MLAGCTPAEGRSAGGFPGRPGAQASNVQEAVEKSFNIKADTVARRDISSKLMLSGDVEASTSVDVYPEAMGKLSAVYIEVGSWVREDQVIAKVDPSKPGMKYAESPVEAPISGTITAVNADPGATVSAQMPLATIGDISKLIITTNVPERYIYMVEKGQSAWISTTAAPGETYEARVTAISPVVNPSSRTLEIELAIIEGSPIKAGMFVGIELRTSTSENSLVISEKAVLSRDEGNYVYRINDERAEKVEVSTGLRDGGFIEITGGLSEGDMIAIEGVSLLSDGAKVRILNNEDAR